MIHLGIDLDKGWEKKITIAIEEEGLDRIDELVDVLQPLSRGSRGHGRTPASEPSPRPEVAVRG